MILGLCSLQAQTTPYSTRGETGSDKRPVACFGLFSQMDSSFAATGRSNRASSEPERSTDGIQTVQVNLKQEPSR